VIWSFVLEPLDESCTRLLTRASAEYDRPSVGLRLHVAGHPMHFAMQRRQLLNEKRRVERLTGARGKPNRGSVGAPDAGGRRLRDPGF
jgi:hypothetical protein